MIERVAEALESKTRTSCAKDATSLAPTILCRVTTAAMATRRAAGGHLITAASMILVKFPDPSFIFTKRCDDSKRIVLQVIEAPVEPANRNITFVIADIMQFHAVREGSHFSPSFFSSIRYATRQTMKIVIHYQTFQRN